MQSLTNAEQKQIDTSMIKLFSTIIICLSACFVNAQTEQEKLTATIKEFHQALITKNTVSINQQTDKALSYGHSNGWVETKPEFLKDLETNYIVYKSYKEDSLSITMNGNLASARFLAEISSTMKGTDINSQLRVLEVWVKKGKRWMLFARQAVKK
jgi:hypothetical protein